MERTMSGYCRAIDAARVVLCELDAGEVDIGCGFETCAHAPQCQVAEQIRQFLREAEEES